VKKYKIKAQKHISSVVKDMIFINKKENGRMVNMSKIKIINLKK